MKFLVATLLVLCTFITSYGQQRKLTKSESANMTQEQRIVHETERKKKGGKKKSKKVSMKKRVKIDKKQDKKARRVKSPKPTHGKKGPR